MYSNVLNIIDILGTFAFAVSGALHAMDKKLDPFGTLVITFTTAIGGGTLRDVLVGNLPVNWLSNNVTIFVIFFGAIVAMLFGSYLRQQLTSLFLFDALGLGMFTILGIEIGLRYQLSVGICITLGTITACFGGVIRDVLLNTVPLIFHKEIYALACVFGGCIYYLLLQLPLHDDISKIICILLIFFIRVIAVRYHLELPRMTLKQ
jgi:uncharacterized membrane protein YeiH